MQKTPAQQDATPVVGVIDHDAVARSGLRNLLHGHGIEVSTFDSAESYLLEIGRAHV
jgi:FixJ family two-component response regulator